MSFRMFASDRTRTARGCERSFLRAPARPARIVASLALLILASAASAQNTPNPDAAIPELMPREREMAMALDAGPAHLRAGATVYVLGRAGYERAQEGTNGFTCIVNRDHPLNLKPTCWDAEGTRTIVPKVLRVGELLMQGKSMAEINAEIKEGFRSGRFQSPQRPGVAYMLSGDIRTWNPQSRTFGTFPPHVMFYAPNLTNADIGATVHDPNLPMVAYQGPHGYMIMMAGRDSSTRQF
jgi:hypothetical protein